MALTEGEQANLDTLIRAAKNGDLALLETEDRASGERRAVIVAIFKRDGEYRIVPFGHLCPGDPYEEYVDPIELTADRPPAAVPVFRSSRAAD